MDYERFITIVRQQTNLDREAAERAVRATLGTLAERLSRGEARDLLRQLPAEAKPWIYTETDIDPFDVDEFLRRVAEREGVDVAVALHHVQAVFYALGRAVTSEEIADLAAELPHDFAPLVAEAMRKHVDVMPAEEFLSRVADRARLGEDGARGAIEAVLETLAERISGGEVDDLISQLAVELHGPLKRGKALGDGGARKMSVDRFLELVSRREGVPLDEARGHARAVLATLREAVSDKEFYDVVVQLPNEYWPLLAHS